MKGLQQGFGTLAVHSGQEPDTITGAVIPPISLSTTFVQPEAGKHTGFDYSRSGNPTRKSFETAIASLEGASYSLAFASGSATTATITNMFPTGSHIISVNDVYGGTFRYFTKVAKNMGIDVSFVDLNNPNELKKHIRENTRMVWIETPTNPTLRLVDIKAVADIAHSNKDLILVVDSTFMSPYFQKPILLGADIVVHSVTKYLNGHSDVVMGVASTNTESIFEKLKFLQNSIGAIPSPFDCYLANRGLKTLHLRMKRHEENAIAISTFLESSTRVSQVIYPGLKSHPQYELACKQQSGFSGMVAFRLKDGNLDNSNLFLKHLKYFELAESLGGVESLAELPAVMTHASLTPQARLELGVTDSLIRLSVGIEDSKDLIDDIRQALEIAVVLK